MWFFPIWYIPPEAYQITPGRTHYIETQVLIKEMQHGQREAQRLQEIEAIISPDFGGGEGEEETRGQNSFGSTEYFTPSSW